MGRFFWYFSKVKEYNDDPNRYSSIYYQHIWAFNKGLLEMNNHKVIYLKDFPDIKFNVYLCIFEYLNKINFVKFFKGFHLNK